MFLKDLEVKFLPINAISSRRHCFRFSDIPKQSIILSWTVVQTPSNPSNHPCSEIIDGNACSKCFTLHPVNIVTSCGPAYTLPPNISMLFFHTTEHVCWRTSGTFSNNNLNLFNKSSFEANGLITPCGLLCLRVRSVSVSNEFSGQISFWFCAPSWKTSDFDQGSCADWALSQKSSRKIVFDRVVTRKKENYHRVQDVITIRLVLIMTGLCSI